MVGPEENKMKWNKKYFSEEERQAARKIDRQNYLNSEKGKKARRKYFNSERTKEMIRKRANVYYHNNKERAAARQKKYNSSEKGRLRNTLYRKKYEEENREKILARQKKYREENREELSARAKRSRLENRTEFLVKAKKYREKNRDRLILQQRDYYSKNRKKLNEQKRKWCSENKDKIKIYQAKRRDESLIYHKAYRARPGYKEKFRNYINTYTKNRARIDDDFRLRKNLRKRIWDALKGTCKSASTMKLIGCTIEELWIHLESCKSWEPWMTRENYGAGGWDVDHIIACAKFNLTDPEQQKFCFHYTNLQPMEHIANIKKGVA